MPHSAVFRSVRSTLLGAAALGALVWSGACANLGQPGSGEDAGNQVTTVCTTRQDCGDPTKEVCSGGVCIPGECEVRADCPFPRDQVCNLELFRCDPDPNSPVGSECPAGDEDCTLGEFCSAGTCYVTSDRSPCARSSQCTGSERCDARVGFCVPNLGGCDRCMDYEELCCLANEEACDPETKRCRAVSSNECTVATQADDCRPSERCVDGRCVQCVTDEECGPGTICNQATGSCVSSSGCTDDADCAIFPMRRCAPANRQCVLPECTTNTGCTAPNVCNLETFQCYLPPAVCNEGATEPNNSNAEATPVTMVNANGARNISGTLCRGDYDVLSFPVTAGKRVEALVTLSPSTSVNGTALTLQGPDGSTLATTTFGFSGASKRIGATVTTGGTAYLRIASGTTSTQNQWNYTVEITESDPPNCGAEVGEPNNTAAQSTNSVVAAGSVSRALCGVDDADYHRVVVPADKRVTVTVDYDDDLYEVEAELLSLAEANLSADSFGSPLTVTYTNRSSTETTLLVHVFHSDSFFYEPPEDPVLYTMTVALEDLPTCDDSTLEPNGSIMEARAIAPGATSGVSCDPDDEDFFRITLSTRGAFNASLAWSGNTDLDLILFNSAGTEVDRAASGSANPEVVDATMLDAGTYYLHVVSYSSTATVYPARYTLTVTAPGFCMDDAFDLGQGNDRAADATPLRDSVDGTLNYTATLSLCRDEDWYRLVALGDERIAVTLSNAGAGAYAAVYRSTSTGPVELARSREITLPDNSKVQWVNVPVNVPAGLYFVKVAGGVTTEGSYTLNIATPQDPCTQVGGDLEPNDVPGNASPVPTPGNLAGVFCPDRDNDLYRFSAAAGAVLSATVSFDAAQGDVDVELWTLGGAAPVASNVVVETGTGATAGVTHTAAAAGTFVLRLARKSEATAPLGQTYSLVVTGHSPPSSSSSSAASGASSAASAGASSAASLSGSSSSAPASASVAGSSSAAPVPSSQGGGSSSEAGASSTEAASSVGNASSVQGASSAETVSSSADTGSSSASAADPSSAAGASSSAASSSSL